jgi:hypothetical protein
MNGPSSGAMASRSGASRLRMISQEYNFADVLDLVALAAIDWRFQEATDESLPDV